MCEKCEMMDKLEDVFDGQPVNVIMEVVAAFLQMVLEETAHEGGMLVIRFDPKEASDAAPLH